MFSCTCCANITCSKLCRLVHLLLLTLRFLKRFGCQISLSSQPGGATLVPISGTSLSHQSTRSGIAEHEQPIAVRHPLQCCMHIAGHLHIESECHRVHQTSHLKLSLVLSGHPTRSMVLDPCQWEAFMQVSLERLQFWEVAGLEKLNQDRDLGDIAICLRVHLLYVRRQLTKPSMCFVMVVLNHQLNFSHHLITQSGNITSQKMPLGENLLYSAFDSGCFQQSVR